MAWDQHAHSPYSFLNRSSGSNEEKLIRNQNVFRCWTVSSIFSLLWLILFSGRIYSENVNWCWSLLTVQKLFLAITTESKRTDGHAFQVYLNIIQNLQLKSKLPVGKPWKRLCFFNCRSVQKDTRIHWKEAFAKPRRLQFPLCLVNSGLFWCLDLWNLWDLWAKGSWCHYFQQPMRGKNLICIWITYKKNHWIYNRAGIAQLA